MPHIMNTYIGLEVIKLNTHAEFASKSLQDSSSHLLDSINELISYNFFRPCYWLLDCAGCSQRPDCCC